MLLKTAYSIEDWKKDTAAGAKQLYSDSANWRHNVIEGGKQLYSDSANWRHNVIEGGKQLGSDVVSGLKQAKSGARHAIAGGIEYVNSRPKLKNSLKNSSIAAIPVVGPLLAVAPELKERYDRRFNPTLFQSMGDAISDHSNAAIGAGAAGAAGLGAGALLLAKRRRAAAAAAKKSRNLKGLALAAGLAGLGGYALS